MNWKLPYFLSLIVIAVSTTLIYHKTQQADINYYEGHRYFEKGEYDEAIEHYKNTILVKTSYFDALRDLAYAYQWTDQHDKAIEFFKQALVIKPNNVKLQIALGETYAWTDQYEKSIDIFQSVLNKTNDIEVAKKVAEVYIWNKQYDIAESVIRDVLKKNPKDSDAELLLARVLQYTGRTKQSIMLYKKILKQIKERK
ncbi:MAG: tetratricopeptide repeat protein [Candidatus Omnitrophica bacterium]|nr:tetratricopeptide repeat protein [Candidatus Omnitrophota bacterium]